MALADLDEAKAYAAAKDLQADGAMAIAVGCDVGDEGSVERAVTSVVNDFGGIDVLINNAARHLKKFNRGFLTLTKEESGAVEVNVNGIIDCCVACHPSMAARGGGQF